jgi:hypothetical protein
MYSIFFATFHILLNQYICSKNEVFTMQTNLYFLSALAYKIANTLTEDELSTLAANLTVLADMLAAISVQSSETDTSDEQNT